MFNRAWAEAAPSGHAPWPPPSPGSPQCSSLFAEPTVFAARVATSMGRFTRMLRSWLRPQFLDELFLERAAERYLCFRQLHRDHPEVTLVPTADIALMWHTHLGLSQEYAEVCKEMFGTTAQGEVNLWRPDYLDITDQCQLAALYVETARLFRNKYELAYDSHETAWVADTVPYPLANTGSPLAYALRVFDDNPDQVKQENISSISLIFKDAGIPEPQPGEPVVRNGAHALYLTWLAAHRAMLAYETVMDCCCWKRSHETTCDKTLRDVTSSLVSIAYFLELPDTDTHPYLMAIKTHNHDSTSALPCNSTVSEPLLRTMAAFKPADPIEYFSGHQDTYMLLIGLLPLLENSKLQGAVWSTPGQGAMDPNTALTRPFRGQSPFGSILATQGTATKAMELLTSAWELAKQRGVGRMQRTYQVMRHRHYGCKVYDSSNDYYQLNTLYMTGVAFINPYGNGP
ncbi:hypothetical protein Vafri_4955, partial [Volvox africanus]